MKRATLWLWPVLGLVALTACLVQTAQAQKTNPNEKEVKPAPNSQDFDEIYDKKTGDPKVGSKLWVLDFKFKPLRSIKVDIPGRGERVCWYLWYQVTNKTLQPHTFVPDFEMVCTDTKEVYRDQILPKVQEAIIAIEDPTNILKIKNSVTITAEPIPQARPGAAPRPVTGLAIWVDPNEPSAKDDETTRKAKEKKPKMTDSNNFSIYIAGLSNGWTDTDGTGEDPNKDRIVRRKTLQLNFRRFGDGALRRDEDIRYISHEWSYRASGLTIPKDETQTDPKAPGTQGASLVRPNK